MSNHTSGINQSSAYGDRNTATSSSFENHLPQNLQSAISVSKSILSRVGIGGDSSSTQQGSGGGLRNSMLASALASTAVDSALVGAGPAAVAAQKGGNSKMATRVPDAATTITSNTSEPDARQPVSKPNGRLPTSASANASLTTANRKQNDALGSSFTSSPSGDAADNRFYSCSIRQ